MKLSLPGVGLPLLCLLLSPTVGARVASAQLEPISQQSIQTIERAMSDELQRSKSDLKLAGLVDPCYISYSIQDVSTLDITAANGALVKSEITHSRSESPRLLLNNYQFDDENYTDNSMMFSRHTSPDNTVPLDNDYAGIRRVLWLSTDDLFKDANENFTKKKAALEHEQLADDLKNLPDFAKAPVISVALPPVALSCNRAQLEELARSLSMIFARRSDIQASEVSISVTNEYDFFQNTEGTTIRQPKTICQLKFYASLQAGGDAEPLTLSRNIAEPRPSDLPSASELVKEAESLANNLEGLKGAPGFGDKSYTGPVLFEDGATRDFLMSNLISRLAAKREEAVSSGFNMSQLLGGMGQSSLKDKLNTRILPQSISVIDNPLMESGKSGQQYLGHYAADEEGVAPTRDLTLVKDGILKTLYSTRTPSKEVQESNGHARESSEAGPGVVEIRDSKAVPERALLHELFQRAKDDGYDYALVVRGIRSLADKLNAMAFNASPDINELLSSGKSIQPSLIYKVYPDGREELLRDAVVTLPTTRDLREIETSKELIAFNVLSASSGGALNFASTIPTTLISPQMVLCPELEVQKKVVKSAPARPLVARPD